MRKVKFFVVLASVIVLMVWGTVPAEAWQPSFPVQTKAVYLINADTNTVVYSKNANEKVYPASTTKIMTAILAAEKFQNNLNATVTLTHADIDPLYGTDGSSAGLEVGETLTVEQLLYCLLLPSSSEAANALARAVAGNVDNFVAMMNQKAKAIGAKNTHYVNAHGLHDPNHYTTAYDTYLIAKYALRNNTIKTIVGTESYDLPKTNKQKARTIYSTNSLLNLSSPSYYYKYCKGIKTGHTSEAGDCLVSYAVKNSSTYICVAMDAPIQKNPTSNLAFSETKQLYQWAYSTFQTTTLIDHKEPQTQVKLDLAWNKDHLLLYADKDFGALIPGNSDLKQVKIKAHLPSSIRAPVKKGQVIGTADVYLANEKMGTVNLVSNEAVARSGSLYFLDLTGRFFSSIWFKLLCVVLIALFVTYLILVVHFSRQKKRLMKYGRKKYKK